MNCDTALTQLLDAEHDELAGIGNTPVALHVRSCAKCNAVASQLLAETRALALAVNYRPALDITPFSSRERVRPSIVAAASVGAIAAFVLVGFVVEYSLRMRVEAGPLSAGANTASFAADSSPNGRDPRVAARDPFVAPLPDTAAAKVRYVTAVPTLPVAYVPAAGDSIVARVNAAPTIDDASSVSIDPPAGRRATVMRGRHPAVTVVWLY